LVNVWLSYFLSVEQSGFVYALPVVVAAQFALLTIFHASLTQVAVVVALTSAGVLAVAEAWFHFHKESPRRKGVGDMETNGLDSL
jgi:hypothetical protein